jgi:hypothetical protein
MPPGLVERLPAGLSTEILEHKNLEEIVFDQLELRDWSNRTSAPGRLAGLAQAAAAGLAWGDRRDFRENYRQAWADLVSERLPVQDVSIVVFSRGQLEVISVDAPTPPAGA